ncbi:hypothetical protein MFLAVUS_003067 [Mucor flavus]|uniref:Endoplasmic reticulum junction formation protein lunapark n=1 Tax=Mucor flavus TaxID=439312 RepID=A0ABP9YS14_9FUNG
MGILFSKNKVDPNNYEQVLSHLEDDIQKKELQLSELRIKDRKVGILWLLYSTILWIIYIVYYLYALKEKSQEISYMAQTASPILLGPFCIETSLISLRKKQKLKVDELKNKTAYYSTKSLLERYDPSSSEKKEIDEQKRRKILQEKEEQKKMSVQQKKQSQMKQQLPPPPPSQYQAQYQNKPLAPQQQQWYDKVVDALVGDVGPETKYALICYHCNAHNGLVLPQEIEVIEYTCPHCHQFNPSRKSRTLRPDGPVSHNMSPKTTATTALERNDNNSQDTCVAEEDLLLRRRTPLMEDQN